MKKLLATTTMIIALAGCSERYLPDCPEYPDDCSTESLQSYTEIPTDTPSNKPDIDSGISSPGPENTETPETERPDVPVNDQDNDPVDTTSNASGNNGKGGNYDKTGHEDNGKGNGKGRD